jgi:hypothetical protein
MRLRRLWMLAAVLGFTLTVGPGAPTCQAGPGGRPRKLSGFACTTECRNVYYLGEGCVAFICRTQECWIVC